MLKISMILISVKVPTKNASPFVREVIVTDGQACLKEAFILFSTLSCIGVSLQAAKRTNMSSIPIPAV